MNKKLRPELQQAVALFYDGEGTPQVTAKGIGDEANEIIAIAEEHGIPLCDNPALVQLLAQIELGEKVPEELYVAVAHVIAFAYQLRQPVMNSHPEQPLPL